MYGHPSLIDQYANIMKPTEDSTMQELFGEAISTYTRAQTIEDGVLVNLMGFFSTRDDVASVCRQHYKFPIACTAAVFDIIDRAVRNPNYCNDYAGIVHDMLWMSKVMKRQIDESTVMFRVIIAGAGRQRNYDFKLAVGPGDQGEPVITIMMPDED